MKRDPTAPKFKGVRACGCVTWLYSSEFDTPKQREKTIADALKEGLEVVQLKTEADMDQARREWGDCPHTRTPPDDPRAEAQRILAEATT